ncbi:MAG TPA: sugar phosphate isomerase/epimerase [Kribbellaceae bacterium]
MPEAVPACGWILWAGTVGLEGPLAARFAAAAAAGYQRVSLSPPEVLRAGRPAAEIASRARDLGLGLVVDPVMNWYPDSSPPTSRFAGVSTDDALRLGADLDATALTVLATPHSDIPLPALAEHFARVCDRAADFGAQVQLEFIPYTVVSGLRVAWEIVRAADRPNGGLVFDTWHFYRGDPDFGVLAAVPGERIFAVQLDDAPAQPTGPLRAETMARLLPGDGELDLVGAIRALHTLGALRWIGPEVMNPELNVRPPEEVARLAMERTRAVLTTALGRR